MWYFRPALLPMHWMLDGESSWHKWPIYHTIEPVWGRTKCILWGKCTWKSTLGDILITGTVRWVKSSEAHGCLCDSPGSKLPEPGELRMLWCRSVEKLIFYQLKGCVHFFSLFLGTTLNDKMVCDGREHFPKLLFNYLLGEDVDFFFFISNAFIIPQS